MIELYKEIIQIMGQIAGIGGLSLAMILILFRDIIQKKIFPKLTRAQSVSLLKYIIIVAGCIAFIGLLSWVVVSIYEQKQKAPLSLIDVVDNSNSNNKDSNYPIDLSGIRWYYPVIINDISKNSISDDVNLERDFPVKFGDNIETVHKKLGMPQETSSIIESYYSEGLRICYDRYTSQVDGFLIQYLESGSVYSGKVLGVKMGDSYAYAKKILGNPIGWGLPDKEYSLAFWKKKNHILILTIWRNSLDPRIGTIRDITYCLESSFLYYIPIVAFTIQEIRAGLQPTFLEDPTYSVQIDFNDPCFQESFEILGADFGIAGGVWIYVRFGDNRIVNFWIYPLEWQYPKVRLIMFDDHENTKMEP